MGFIILLILFLFLLGIGSAAWYTHWAPEAPRPDDMPAYLAVLVSALNSAFALNLGILLGIRVAFGSRSPGRYTKEWILKILAIWYGIGWILATVFWGMTDFTKDSEEVVAVLPEVSETGIKIFVAVLFALLGLKTAYVRARGRGSEVDSA